MKHLKPFAILLALLLVLSMAIPAFAQDEEAEEETSYVGTIEILEGEDGEDGDIVFTTEDGDVFILAPSGSFSPSVLADYEEGALFELEGDLLNEGDEDNPATMQVTSFAEYDVETDTDEDGVVDVEDNCPDIANTEQTDTDGDGFGDECDEFPDVADDMDNDGVTDAEDICPEVANPVDEETGEQAYPVDTDEDGVGDACEEAVDEEEELGEGGFYCRNRDVQHPAGARIATAYGESYETLIADFCGDEGGRRGWGVIRNELRGDERGNGNGNGNGGNGNGNGNGGNGNGNGNGNGGGGNGNGNGNGGGGNGNGNGNGRGN